MPREGHIVVRRDPYESDRILIRRGRYTMHIPITQAVRVADKLIDLVEAERVK